MQAKDHGAVSAAIPNTPETETQVPAHAIAIVGAEFCGTTLAIHLLRQVASLASFANLSIFLVDPRPDLGAGVAYATRDYPYPLNVAARQMSIDSANAADFLQFVRGQGSRAEAGDYLPRQVYGDYVAHRRIDSVLLVGSGFTMIDAALRLAAIRTLVRGGVLELHAGRIVEVTALDDAVEVMWRPRGAQRPRAWLVDLVINCTGPESRIAANADPLVQSLLANGLVRGDALSLGLDVTDDGRAVSRDGAPVDRLYYLGPWLRARDWEATAVPELREHAARLARRLSAEITPSSAQSA
ncbi:MAG: FAD/NAD(P)-binding protein [Pseudomonadota bacterium]